MRSSSAGQQPACSCSATALIADFYREEFLKRQAQLRQQRECYSASAVAGAEAALDLILMRIESLSALDHADHWSAGSCAASMPQPAADRGRKKVH
jgi:hypothetical protein